MQEIAQNRFNEGISKDVSALLQKDTTAIHMENVTVFTKENQNYVVTNIRGTDHVFQLPQGYTVIGSKTYANICYLLLAETINGNPTGRGQIGSFPSPEYPKQSGQLLFRYSPFMNYGGDFRQHGAKNGPFISQNFKFSVDKNVDMVIQRAYDGSVNVIFSDGKNPMRLINSAFRTSGDNNYEIVEREGGNQNNRYDAFDFENTINLVLTTNTLTKVIFDGVFTGGKVKSGNYIYYFKYATNDGNETSFVAESSLVQVAVGDGIFSVRGGKGDGEDTDKQVRFRLAELDKNYDYLIVYFMHSTGESSTVNNFYRIDTKIPISNGQATFTHSGFENVLLEDSSVLQDIFGMIDTADTLTETQGYLIAGGIKQKSYDRSVIRDFARQIKLTSTQKEMEAGLGNPFEVSLKRSSSEPVKDFYNLGYYNPLNVYHGLGYWGGEAYPFGFRLVLNSGELSDVYPVLGCDNITGFRTLFEYGNYSFDGIDSAAQGFEQINGFNTKGVYRFPRRTSQTLYDPATDTVKINGITFTLPTIPEAIKKISKGIVFVRGDRKPNVLTQGIITDMFKIPVDDRYNNDDRGSNNRRLNLYGTYDTVYKTIPAPGFKLEASYLIEDKNRVSGYPGVHYAHFTHLYNQNKYQQGGGWRDSFAFYAGENFAQTEKALSVFARNDCKIYPISEVSFIYDVRTSRANSFLPGDSGESINDHFSLLRPSLYQNAPNTAINVRTTFILGGNNEPIGEDKFASACYFMDMEASKGHVGVFPLAFDDYVGLKVTDANRFTIGSTNGINGRMSILGNRFGQVEKMSWLCNIYTEGGEWNVEALRQNWLDISTVRYFSISERISWDEIENKVDQNRSITLFRGDCFTVPTYRRLYRNRFGKDENVSDSKGIDDRKRANVGFTMSWISENSINVALRVPVFDNVNSSEASTFAPFGKDLQPNFNAIADNSWRRIRQDETKTFNFGYAKTSGDNYGIAVDFDRPFSENDWYSRLMNSARHIPNAFVNGYRQWGFDLQDYDPSKGRITKLMPYGNDILMIQEDGISVIPINQRMESAQDNAGPVFIQSTEVLSPYQGYVSHYIGSQHPDSIVATENAVYGYDAKRFTWWRAGFDKSFVSISDLTIGSFFEKHARNFSTTKFNKYSGNIVAGWDIRNRQVLLSFFDTANNKSFTVAYSEYTNFVTGFSAYHAMNFFMLQNRIYSVPVTDRRKVYLHDSETQKRLLVYGEPKKAIIRFAVNKQHEVNKVFDFMEIVSNNVLPDKVLYWIQGASAEQDIVYDATNIFVTNAKYREEKAVINIPRAGWKNDRSVTQYLEQSEDNAVSQIFDGGRIRGKVLVVELQYSTDKLLEISSVLTYFRKSAR